MVFVAHFSTPSQTELIGKMTQNAKSKIPVYAKDFKNEWLYIVGINRKCGLFIKKLKQVFSSSRAIALVRDFKNVLEAQKRGKLQNISQLKFKLRDVERIIYLKFFIYINMGNNYFTYNVLNKDFQYFFENLIIFTNNVNIKDKEDFLIDDDLSDDDLSDDDLSDDYLSYEERVIEFNERVIEFGSDLRDDESDSEDEQPVSDDESDSEDEQPDSDFTDDERVIEFDGDLSDDDYIDQINILLNNL